MKLLIVTDTWSPQVNGVVTTLRTIGQHVAEAGHHIEFLTPGDFRSMPCPTYPEIRLSLLPYRRLSEKIESFQPDALHIATEGPLGYAARRYCVARDLQFTTAYHTRFPEYVHARTRIPVALTYRWLRRFHRRASSMLVPTPALRRELQSRGFGNTVPWSHGVDTRTFTPGDRSLFKTPSPNFLYVGRVAIEKNIEAFLQLELPGSKWVVGEGPQRAALERKYPDVSFAGIQSTENLVRFYRSADVFVFPSLTDTFGLVMLEALACGTPVAAFPVAGPIDVIGDSNVGVMDNDLRKACMAALSVSRADARAYAEQFSWARSVRQFESYLAPFRAARLA